MIIETTALNKEIEQNADNVRHVSCPLCHPAESVRIGDIVSTLCGAKVSLLSKGLTRKIHCPLCMYIDENNLFVCGHRR